MCRELQTAWQAIALEFNFGVRQQLLQTQRLMPPEEKSLCLSFEIKMSETRGTLNLAIPAVVSNALLEKNLRRLQLCAPPRSDRRPPPDSERCHLFLPRRTLHARSASAFREHHRTRSRRPALFFPERLRASRDAGRWSSSMLGYAGARQQPPRRQRPLSRNSAATQR